REVASNKGKISLEVLMNQPNFHRECISMKASLLRSDTGIISEFKRKSPSKGWIKEHAEADVITQGYCKAGASGISILTDQEYFGGNTQDLMQARSLIDCPILRKDFIVDTYQLYEAKSMGADVVLLIAASLTMEDTKALAQSAKDLGLEVLLEIHSEQELEY